MHRKLLIIYLGYFGLVSLIVGFLYARGFFEPKFLKRAARLELRSLKFVTHRGDEVFSPVESIEIRSRKGVIKLFLNRREIREVKPVKAIKFKELSYKSADGRRVIGSEVEFDSEKYAIARIEGLTKTAYGQVMRRYGDIRCYYSQLKSAEEIISPPFLVNNLNQVLKESKEERAGKIVGYQYTVVLRSRNKIFYLTEIVKSKQKQPILLQAVLMAGYGD